MAAGFNLDQTCDVGYCDDLTLAPGVVVNFSCTWNFTERMWLRLSFSPLSDGRLTILSEWSERRLLHFRHFQVSELSIGAQLRNDSSSTLTVRPMVLVAPSRW